MTNRLTPAATASHGPAWRMGETVTMARVARHAQDHGSHWFDASTLAWFGSHAAAGPIIGADGRAWFVSSEQDRNDSGMRAWNGARRFTVRAYDPIRARVETVGEFGEHATRASAYRAMRDALRTLPAR